MTSISDIINNFSSEEQQGFLLFLEHRNKTKDPKNVQLFKYLKENKYTSKEICSKLYPDNNASAYHALRKRLYDNIIDFIASSNLNNENSLEMNIIKLLIVARNFFQKKQYKVAINILNKAEKKAKEHFQFTLLSEIYHTKIQFAHVSENADINIFINEFEENKKNQRIEEQLNMVYAKIRLTINDVIFKGDTVNLKEIIDKTFTELNIVPEDVLTFKSFYQLITIYSISAFATKDYLSIENYLTDTYNKLKNHKNIDNQQYYHIQVVYLMANMFFRNKKFKQALEFLSIMEDLMTKEKTPFFKTFNSKHKNLLALTLNYSGNIDAAIEIIEQLHKNSNDPIETTLDIHLCKTMYYFQKGNFKHANKLINQLYHTDSWYEQKAGIEWVMKKNLIDILLQIELDNIDLVSSRILSFRRRYNEYLKSINQHRVLVFLKFIERIHKEPELLKTKKLNDSLELAFDYKTPESEDIFVMSFFAWLKAKTKGLNLYDTTIELVTLENVN